MEIAPEHCGPVSDLARHVMPNAHVFFSKDLLGLPRVVGIDLEMGIGPEHNMDNSSGAHVMETAAISVSIG